ncbi:hypothetical protein Gpo141_00003507 [Globisporangium polare]
MTTYILPSPNTSATSTEKYLSVAKTIETKSRDPTKQCCYPSKRCENPRVLKSNGELHRFCDEHRARANLNQRRLEERRREEQAAAMQQQQTQQQEQTPQQQPQMSLEAYMAQLDRQYGISDEQAVRFDLAPSMQQPSDLLVELDLDEEDLRVLAAVLSVDEDDCMD